MSSAGYYSLDAYCDVCDVLGQFTGTSEAMCIREARHYGWSIGKPSDDGRSVRCPEHKGQRIPKEPPDDR